MRLIVVFVVLISFKVTFQQFQFFRNLVRSRPVLTCNCECGTYKRQKKIVGGEESVPNEFPWVVRLQDLTNSKYVCGGTLITRNFVLTAAHCVSLFPKSQLHKIRVILGDHDRDTLESDTRQYRRVQMIHLHEKFNPKFGYDNDIAIVQLDVPVNLNNDIQPLCLPPNNEDRDYSGQTGIVCGWGRSNEYDSSTSNVLRKLKVPIWSHDQCLNSRYVTKKLTKNMICAGYPEGVRDACSGDSGGPLQVSMISGHMELVGIVSFGQGCARKNLPGVYTKIHNYVDWIQNIIQDECLCQPYQKYSDNYNYNQY